jgi:hypothetical protein
MDQTDMVAISALVISLATLIVTVLHWRRSARPIVSAMVKTHLVDENRKAILNLTLMNSGTMPARNITLRTCEEGKLDAALDNPTEEEKVNYLECLSGQPYVAVLQNGAEISCAFGYFGPTGRSFWKPLATFPILIRYEGWFGWVYEEEQIIKIADSTSFTDSAWKGPSR